MTDQSEQPASQSGEWTVPLVPDGGYAQPEVPPLEEPAWPDFSYDDYASTAPVPQPAPAAPFRPVTQTAPLPYLDPQAGLAYQQPSATYAQPAPAYQPTQSYPLQPATAAYQPQPSTSAARPAEPGRYETYQPYTPPVPVAYGYPLTVTAAPEHPNAVASLVLGIAGLFVLPILAPIAWFIAGRGRSEMRRYPGRWSSSGSLTAGYVLGILGTLLWGAALAFFVLIVVLAASSGL